MPPTAISASASSDQELPQTDKIRIGMHNRHVAIIFRYQRAKSSFPLETRGNFVANGKIHSKSRRGLHVAADPRDRPNVEAV
jgi:hypothetical protein